MKQIIGNTKIKGRNFIRSILKENEKKDHFYNEILMQLLKKYHPRGKAQNAVTLYYGPLSNNPFGKESVLQIVKDDGERESISWNTCLDQVYRRVKGTKNHTKAHKQVLLLAMRSAIFHEKRFEYLKSHGFTKTSEGVKQAICEACGSLGSFEVDHKSVTFSEISERFLQKYNLEDIKVSKNTLCYEIDDVMTRNKWINFHDSHADFSVLCKECHRAKTKSANYVL